jgi:hypothetical protein
LFHCVFHFVFLLGNKKIHPHEKSRWDEFHDPGDHKIYLKIFLRRYYPYQVQGFGAFRLSRRVTAPLIFYAVLIGICRLTYYTR